METEMRIINLVENEPGDSGCEAAHGLSFYVETQAHRFLFDTSPSELVIRNAQKLGVDLTSVDTVILSHGHYDHSGGILPFVEINPRTKIYMQSNAGGEYYAFDGEDKGFRYIGIDKKILSLPQVQLLKGDTKIDDELQLFTVDNRTFPLPSTNKRLRQLCNGQYIQDEFHHEQNLLLTTGGKKILFCGCAHNGILNVMETLERKFGPASLPDLVIGGFHLMKRTEFSEADTAEITEIANRLKSYKSHFATCHCTGLPVFNQMKEIMGGQLSYVRSGDEVLVE
ncbi:MBL fold metallo-hydrolase [Treponema sp. JC4]|uniref:MBL fold metallo-hydrolase n=1 Tax=Treponema sp. JC4 TaxID=1124982 RepID=UPI0002F8D473|nr:MBL fold metallo-hydrolase [Treponema sp. JC4]